MSLRITVVGAGLAGCEAAWQAAKRGIEVTLCEMKPEKKTPAHKSDGFAELVCSNSLRSDDKNNAVGLLKEEMRLMGSLIIEAADKTRVPAGSALAVDRNAFSDYVTGKLSSHPNIKIVSREVSSVEPDTMTIIATGPLTSEPMANYISDVLGISSLHFYDAAAPIVDGESIDCEKTYFASRYGKGDAMDYLNCPMEKDEYLAFYEALLGAQTAKLHEFDDDEKISVFEGCMPVEVMASRGVDTLRYGPMKPVGLQNPKTGREPYAALQLRRENEAGTMYNLVGFQTHLTFPEQKRVFSMIPGLENAEFLRYGVMHRNTYINSPGILAPDYSLISSPDIFFAGQMTGVEGYVESAASGMLAGISAARRLRGQSHIDFTKKTMTGALGHYVSEGGASGNFQPMNASYGIVEPLEVRVKGGKKMRYAEYSKRALLTLSEIIRTEDILK
ncbi:MAG: methylenetetrahydrofolate--tRNA-(uracil(54)-C(5))-methyltransferase (FADH(2)-oxidizing) TrmFO [Clostridia bacterium]|nr:methylenetetrahydrofolate--tRNA-(uracil(54)-C(5))-methyltransferase (FADH(2)-oxidizing) TrmFO [Clostridia bacterium]